MNNYINLNSLNSVSKFPCFQVSVFPSFRVSKFPCSQVSVFPSFRVPKFLCSQVSVFPSFRVPVFLCSCVPVFLCSCVPVFPSSCVLCSCVPKFLCCPFVPLSLNECVGTKIWSQSETSERADGRTNERTNVWKLKSQAKIPHTGDKASLDRCG